MLRVIGTLLQKTDRKRWANPRNLYASWEPRTKLAAGLVPNNSRVIEFGAGNRNLERYLDSSCAYTPSDLVERGPETIVCDLNQRPLPDLGAGNYDVAVCLGVLEYVQDLPAVLDWLTRYVRMCVLTYACATTSGHSPRAILERLTRLRHGWINNFTENELRSLFEQRGYKLEHDQNWETQRVFVFGRGN